MIVAVVGKGRNCDDRTARVAWHCGHAVARHGHLTLTGGLGGVMLTAAYGAHIGGGASMGLLPAGRDPDPSFPGILVPTGLSEPMRNVMIGTTCDAMIACRGSHGTLQEIAVALDREIPLVAVETRRWERELGEPIACEEVDEWLTKFSVPAGI